MIGEHRVAWNPTVASSPPATGWLDVSCDAFDVTTHYGRDDPSSQPEASTATIDLDGAAPAGLDIGLWILVESGTGASSWAARFTGRVSDMTQEYRIGRDADGQIAAVPFLRVIAAGPLADMGRRYVGDAPWPAELDGARVKRIFDLAGMPYDPLDVDPGTVAILARDVDRQPALELSQAVADDGGGIVVDKLDGGKVAFHDSEHRRASRPEVVLDSCQILMSPQWTRDLAGLVNDAAVAYGVAPEGGEQPVVTATNPASQARYGRVAYSVATQLADVDAATARASSLVTRGAWPVWDVSSLLVDLTILPDATRVGMLSLGFGDLLGLTGLPANAPNLHDALWVEGWSEHLAAGEHELTITVSGYCRTVPAPRWDDVDPGRSWDSMAGSWDGAYCLGPVVGTERWNDVPAAWKWASPEVAGISWDQWTGS